MTQTLSPQPTTPAYVCEICQQDGSTCAHSLTPAPATKQTPVEKRLAFIIEAIKPVNDRAKAILAAKQVGLDLQDLNTEELTAVAERMSAEGPALGKTSRWKNACGFAIIEIKDAEEKDQLDANFARWAVVQASVWMCHAAD